jgi:hypothetical protein
MHTIHLTTLADLGDVLSGLMPIIFVILYGIAHLVGNFQKEKRKAPPRAKPVQPPDFAQPGGAQRAAGGNQPTLEETLRREVEEFLRRAQGQQPEKPKAQQRQQQRAQQQQQRDQRPTLPQARRQPPRAPAPQLRPVRRLVETERPEHAAPVSPLATPRPLAAPTPLGTGTALHSQTLLEHAQPVGSHIPDADERMAAHLRETFTHRRDALAPATINRDQQTAAANAALQLRTMLSRPESVRQIIIASEILRRPDERWQ